MKNAAIFIAGILLMIGAFCFSTSTAIASDGETNSPDALVDVNQAP